MITSDRTGRQPTKQRLLEAGVRLFAANGFRETTVGEIEAAAGLEPRRGALYRHFESKEALLDAACRPTSRPWPARARPSTTCATSTASRPPSRWAAGCSTSS